jgi:hypothetical protein
MTSASATSDVRQLLLGAGHPYWDGYGWVYPRVGVCQ